MLARVINYKAIAKLMGMILIIIGLSMIPSYVCATYYHESKVARGLFISMVIILAVGFILFAAMKLAPTIFRAREGYLAVALCWLIASLFGIMPFLFTGTTHSFVDALFESTAGFTTTGCTVIDVSAFSKGTLLWKATSNWLGGMGILIFVISVFPALGINGQVIAKLETPTPVLEKATIRMTDTAKVLYSIYICFSLLEFVVLNFGSRMTTLDALINTLSSISTAGIFIRPGGLAYYGSCYVNTVICVFSLLGSVNFILYFYLIRGNWKLLIKDLELKTFAKIIISAIVLCTLTLTFISDFSFSESIKLSAVQCISVMTTSGFTITDISWPSTCLMVFFILMFIGGCSASTSGSLKVIRVIIMCKYIKRGLYRKLHPRAITSMNFKNEPVPRKVKSNISVFIIAFFGTFLLGCFILSFQGLELMKTCSSVISLMSNTGLSFNNAGVTSNDFTMYSPAIKIFLSILMMVGRLELFTIIILFTRSFWNRKN